MPVDKAGLKEYYEDIRKQRETSEPSRSGYERFIIGTQRIAENIAMSRGDTSIFDDVKDDTPSQGITPDYR